MLCLEDLRKYGIVHRDIKPENFIFNHKGVLTLVDFGTSDVIEENQLNHKLFEKIKDIKMKIGQQVESIKEDKKSFVGTIFYLAPEMITEQNVDYGADLWALGIIIYRAYTGKYLFNDQNNYSIFEKIKNGQWTADKTLPEEV